MYYIVVKFQIPNSNTCRDMNYFLPFRSSISVKSRQTTDYRQQTESNAYESTVQIAQVGSKIKLIA